MSALIFSCGAECGVSGSHSPVTFTNVLYSTTTKRTGDRSYQFNPSAASTELRFNIYNGSLSNALARVYVYFSTLPDHDFLIVGIRNTGGVGGAALLKQSDSKIYAWYGDGSFGATGISITTGQWYRIDIRESWPGANPRTTDVQVDGVSCGQNQFNGGATTYTDLILGIGYAGSGVSTWTGNVFIDDITASETFADYPIGAGYVNHFIPTSDGTHNIAGANDFERSATGVDIINSTTTAFQLIDDVPLKSGVVAEYINLVAPPNSSNYVEVIFGPAPGISTPTVAPRHVTALVAYASATTGTNNLRLALNDNGTLSDVLNTTTAPGTTAVYANKKYQNPPSGLSGWTLSGNGNFNNLKMRCFTNDAAPDPWWASAMLEAEFAEIVSVPNPTNFFLILGDDRVVRSL